MSSKPITNFKQSTLFLPLLLFVIFLWGVNNYENLPTYTTTDYWLAIARLTGLWGSALLLLQLLFTSRFPFIERSLSKDSIIKVHRTAGFWSFWLIFTHIITSVISYKTADNLWNTYQTLLQLPGMWLATFAFASLLVVVALSMRKIFKRYRY